MTQVNKSTPVTPPAPKPVTLPAKVEVNHVAEKAAIAVGAAAGQIAKDLGLSGKGGAKSDLGLPTPEKLKQDSQQVAKDQQNVTRDQQWLAKVDKSNDPLIGIDKGLGKQQLEKDQTQLAQDQVARDKDQLAVDQHTGVTALPPNGPRLPLGPTPQQAQVERDQIQLGKDSVSLDDRKIANTQQQIQEDKWILSSPRLVSGDLGPHRESPWEKAAQDLPRQQKTLQAEENQRSLDEVPASMPDPSRLTY